jgi:hypothetical protein
MVAHNKFSSGIQPHQYGIEIQSFRDLGVREWCDGWLLFVIYIHNLCPFIYGPWPMRTVNECILKPFTQSHCTWSFGSEWPNQCCLTTAGHLFIREVPSCSTVITPPGSDWSPCHLAPSPATLSKWFQDWFIYSPHWPGAIKKGA